MYRREITSLTGMSNHLNINASFLLFVQGTKSREGNRGNKEDVGELSKQEGCYSIMLPTCLKSIIIIIIKLDLEKIINLTLTIKQSKS